jgi:O-antigen/teichoic acid export membrane protein
MSRSRFAELAVPASLVGLAASGYLTLVLGARALPGAAFAALSAFYLLANTVGRGTFAALELELTRGVARARAQGVNVQAVCRAALVRGALLVAGVLVLLAVTSPLLVRAVGEGHVVALLGLAAVGLAASSYLRGPLAGDRRYGIFAASLGAEAAVALGGAVVLLVLQVHSIEAWVALFAVGPFAGVLVVAASGLAWSTAVAVCRGGHTERDTTGDPAFAALLWSSLLFLCSQGVWNLAPVVATGRAPDLVDEAAGFSASVVLLRAPVMIFPAIQALLLPRLVRADVLEDGAMAGAAARRRLVVAGAGLAVAWMVVAVVLVPPVVVWLFTAGDVPPRPMIALVAVAILAGTAAQFTQARLLAQGRTPAVALVWLAALLVLLGVSVLPGDPFWAASAAMVAGTVVALVAMAVVLRRSRRG